MGNLRQDQAIELDSKSIRDCTRQRWGWWAFQLEGHPEQRHRGEEAQGRLWEEWTGQVDRWMMCRRRGRLEGAGTWNGGRGPGIEVRLRRLDFGAWKNYISEYKEVSHPRSKNSWRPYMFNYQIFLTFLDSRYFIMCCTYLPLCCFRKQNNSKIIVFFSP